MKSLRTLLRLASAGLALSLLTVVARADEPAPARSQARFEENFLSDMIDHQLLGAKLAELAATRATHPELRALAGMIRTTEEAQVENMRQWLAEWYEVEYQPELDPRGEHRVANLAGLTGDEFERGFMVEMALHHGEAIAAAEPALLRAYHADLIGLARDILSLQADELALFRIWLNQWHQVREVTPADRGLVAAEGTEDTATATKPSDPNGNGAVSPPVTAPSAVTTSPSGGSVATDTAGTAPGTVTSPGATTP